MFALVKTGGKQYFVKPGDVLRVEKIISSDDTQNIKLDEVLFIKKDDGESIFGSPKIDGASVVADVLKQMRCDKIVVFKKKRRHNYRRKNGHRQQMTVIKIKEILTK